MIYRAEQSVSNANTFLSDSDEMHCSNLKFDDGLVQTIATTKLEKLLLFTQA